MTSRRRLWPVLPLSALLAALIVPVAPAAAQETPVPPAVMDEYPAAEFAAEAAELPDELEAAVQRDLGIGAVEYLAEAEAAADAVVVVEGLEEVGIEVLGSRLEGTELIVSVADTADAAVVAEAGGIAEIGTPAPVEEAPREAFTAADSYSGTGYTWGKWQCSVGFNGYRTTDGAPQMVTAGHCFDGATASTVVRALIQNKPTSYYPQGTGPSAGSAIGSPLMPSVAFGEHKDAALLNYNGSTTPHAKVATWGGGIQTPLAGTEISVRGQTQAVVGANLCKSGSRTGWTCGTVLQVNETINVGGKLVNSVRASTCTLPGDSGGVALIGTRAVGISSSTASVSSCSGGGYFAGFFPLVSNASGSGGTSVASMYGSNWEPAVVLSRPTITSPQNGLVSRGTGLRGTVPNATSGTRVAITMDGAPLTTATVGSSGSFSASIRTVPPGPHTFTFQALWGKHSSSAILSRTLTVVEVDRVSSTSRETLGALISRSAFPDGAGGTVYLATGASYSTMLSASAAAGHLDGPVLYIGSSGAGTALKQELARLQPERLVFLASATELTTAELNTAKAAVPGVPAKRIYNSDRYVMSRQIIADAFATDGVLDDIGTLYISNGSSVAGALVAGSAAAERDAPLLIVDGKKSALPSATVSFIQQLDPENVIITGSTGGTSAGIAAQIDAIPGVSVQRIAASSVPAISAAVNAVAFAPQRAQAYVAPSASYVNAIPAAAAAAQLGAPLYLSEAACLPPEVHVDIARAGGRQVTLVGSTSVLTSGVGQLRSC